MDFAHGLVFAMLDFWKSRCDFIMINDLRQLMVFRGLLPLV